MGAQAGAYRRSEDFVAMELFPCVRDMYLITSHFIFGMKILLRYFALFFFFFSFFIAHYYNWLVLRHSDLS